MKSDSKTMSSTARIDRDALVDVFAGKKTTGVAVQSASSSQSTFKFAFDVPQDEATPVLPEMEVEEPAQAVINDRKRRMDEKQREPRQQQQQAHTGFVLWGPRPSTRRFFLTLEDRMVKDALSSFCASGVKIEEVHAKERAARREKAKEHKPEVPTPKDEPKEEPEPVIDA